MRGKPRHEQVSLAVSLILESPNGEYKNVFGRLAELDASAAGLLAQTIDPKDGLLREPAFKSYVANEVLIRNLRWFNAEQLSCMAYVLMLPSDVEKIKTYLKTHPIAPTKIIGHIDVAPAKTIGHMGGIVGALLPCNAETACKIIQASDAGPYAIVQYSPVSSFEKLHKRALVSLKSAAWEDLHDRKSEIAGELSSGKDPGSLISRYLEVKTLYERLK